MSRVLNALILNGQKKSSVVDPVDIINQEAKPTVLRKIQNNFSSISALFVNRGSFLRKKLPRGNAFDMKLNLLMLF